MLNELECVGAEIYANIWQTDRIVRFRPSEQRGDGLDQYIRFSYDRRPRGTRWDPFERNSLPIPAGSGVCYWQTLAKVVRGATDPPLDA